MYDVRQFRPALYVLLILGFSGFALAADTSGLWLLAVTLVLLNAWLIKRGSFFPLPRIIANLVTLAALLYIVIEVRLTNLVPILVIGQFLVMLQLVKVYEQRANRDYAQLLVLSLLLVVAASINTASLLFGLLLIVYLFLSLYCCLLFHLKVESDHAKAAIAISEEKLNPASLRHDQRYLARSMRKLTFFVSATAIVMAVLVFLFFPRGTGANLLAPLQQRTTQTLTGFSDTVSFENIAKISQNNEIVAHVRVWHSTVENGKRVEKQLAGTQTILLRGTTLNIYHGGTGLGATWQWDRRTDDGYIEKGGEQLEWISSEDDYQNADLWRQEIWLTPTGTSVLFAMPGPVAIRTDRDLERAHYLPADESLQLGGPLAQPAYYEVLSRGSLDFRDKPKVKVVTMRQRDWMVDSEKRITSGMRRFGLRNDPTPHTDPRLMEAFREFAQRPEVSGLDDNGPLASQRRRDSTPVRIDAQIAANIAQYLRNNYSYTLDLTDVRKLGDGRDPLYAFLTDFKKGHCEYFAGAMTLLCQSLGMQARIVVGFKCDEYNSTPGADYYIVRQSQAHAWVEVRTPEGWESFDPTSSREASAMAQAGVWQKFKHLLDYLEYTWANKVVAYDRDEQGNVLRNAEQKLVNMSGNGLSAASSSKSQIKKTLQSWFTETNFFIFSSKLLSGLIYLAFFAAFGAVGGFFWERWKLRRRAKRIGLENLSASAQMRLARQLGFYDDLMQLLERYNISRPRHLTPMEFSDSITFLPNEAYDAVRRLTQIFYRIRFGGHEITYSQRQRLNRVIGHVGELLERRRTPY